MVFGFFKNKKKELQKEEFRLEDLVLSKLKVGFLVDYDLKTYRVSACNKYQWNEGGVSDEWELTSGSESFFLERSEEDGDVEWSFCHKLPISKLEGDIADEIERNEEKGKSALMLLRLHPELKWFLGLNPISCYVFPRITKHSKLYAFFENTCYQSKYKLLKNIGTWFLKEHRYLTGALKK